MLDQNQLMAGEQHRRARLAQFVQQRGQRIHRDRVEPGERLVQDLCEDVAILDHGRVVLAGRLSELRAGAPQRRLEVTLGRDAGERWWERWSQALPDVRVAGGDGRSVRLTVDRSVDLEKVLTEARSTAEVVRFDFDPPSLSEIFREAVRT